MWKIVCRKEPNQSGVQINIQNKYNSCAIRATVSTTSIFSLSYAPYLPSAGFRNHAFGTTDNNMRDEFSGGLKKECVQIEQVLCIGV